MKKGELKKKKKNHLPNTEKLFVQQDSSIICGAPTFDDDGEGEKKNMDWYKNATIHLYRT